MILAYVLEYILLVILMIACFFLYNFVAKKTIAIESVRLIIRGSFLSFLIVMVYTAIIAAIVGFYGNRQTTNVMLLIVLIFNATVNISFTVFYYLLKTGETGE